MKDQRWLTIEEDHAIARALSAGSGGFTDEEFATAIRWAESSTRHACLELVLRGLVALRLRPDGEIEMRAIGGPHSDDLVEGKGAE